MRLPFNGARLADQIQQFVEDQQSAMVRLGGGDLKKATPRGKGEQSTLFAGNRAPMLQVALVADDYYRHAPWYLTLAVPDVLQLLPHHVEA